MLHILTYPDPRLHLKAEPVVEFNAELKQIAKDMIATMYNSNGVGLASIQVNIQKALFIMDLSEEGNNPQVFVNPKIIKQEGSQTNKEGCLSFPDITIKVTRPKTIEVEYQDLNGNYHKQTGSDLFAQCVHHECEHLSGEVFIKDLSRLKLNMVLRKLKKHQSA